MHYSLHQCDPSTFSAGSSNKTNLKPRTRCPQRNTAAAGTEPRLWTVCKVRRPDLDPNGHNIYNMMNVISAVMKDSFVAPRCLVRVPTSVRGASKSRASARRRLPGENRQAFLPIHPFPLLLVMYVRGSCYFSFACSGQSFVRPPPCMRQNEVVERVHPL